MSQQDEEKKEKKCVFCNIPPERMLFQNERLYIIQDIKPDAFHHYLVIPKNHVGNIKSLRKEEKELITEMESVGTSFITQKTTSPFHMGFHIPPFNSIEHLHMHVLSGPYHFALPGPIAFWRHSLWFISTSDLASRLSQKGKL